MKNKQSVWALLLERGEGTRCSGERSDPAAALGQGHLAAANDRPRISGSCLCYHILRNILLLFHNRHIYCYTDKFVFQLLN